ncbi:MAG TPA: hypothetical protein PLY87_00995 [Planctomycetaceae bacterium]|nr:hypothetical protein [Planctomycetaceae bacterium]
MATSTLPQSEREMDRFMGCSPCVLEKFPHADIREIRYWMAALCSKVALDVPANVQISVSPGAPWAISVRA